MAINNETQTQTEATQQPQMNFASQAAPANAAPTISFHSGSFGAGPIGRRPGSEILSTLTEKLTETYKSAQDVKFELVQVDNNNDTVLAFSVLVVVAFRKGNMNLASYHSLLLEATGDKPQPLMENFNNGEMIERLRVTGDAYDSVMVETILRKLNTAFPKVRMLNADAEVVPATFDYNNKVALHTLAVNAAMACFSELQSKDPNFKDLNMAHFQRDSSLVVSPRFERSVQEGVDSLPRRQDVKITFSSQLNRQNSNTSLNSGERATKLADLSGFVDLIWAPTQLQNPYGAMMPVMPGMPQIPQHKYVANLVVTSLVTEQFSTLAGMLLALTSLRSVSEANNWYGAFRSNGLRQNMHDIGYLNLEANVENNPNGIGKPFDTSLDSFSAMDLYKFLSSVIRPGIVVSMDVPECGPESWYLSVFSQAASLDPRQTDRTQAARMAIYNAANELTNGRFSQHFTAGKEMFVNMGNRVHMGWYEDSQNQRRDLRDIDYVAVAALTKDPEQIKRWSDSYNATSVPLIKRLDVRQRLIRAVVPNANFTGFANRVTFSNEFLSALVVSCAEVGVAPRLDSNGLGITPQDRGVASFVDGAVVAPNAGQFFSFNQPNAQGFANYSPNGFRSY
jgi:hypothetical protein